MRTTLFGNASTSLPKQQPFSQKKAKELLAAAKHESELNTINFQKGLQGEEIVPQDNKAYLAMVGYFLSHLKQS